MNEYLNRLKDLFAAVPLDGWRGGSKPSIALAWRKANFEDAGTLIYRIHPALEEQAEMCGGSAPRHDNRAIGAEVARRGKIMAALSRAAFQVGWHLYRGNNEVLAERALEESERLVASELESWHRI